MPSFGLVREPERSTVLKRDIDHPCLRLSSAYRRRSVPAVSHHRFRRPTVSGSTQRQGRAGTSLRDERTGLAVCLARDAAELGALTWR